MSTRRILSVRFSPSNYAEPATVVIEDTRGDGLELSTREAKIPVWAQREIDAWLNTIINLI